MAQTIVIVEGFDHYATGTSGDNTFPAGWTFNSGATATTLVTGLLGSGRALNWLPNGGGSQFYRNFGGTEDTACSGFRFKLSVMNITGCLHVFGDSAGDQGWVRLNSGGTLSYYRGSSGGTSNTGTGTNLGTSTFTLASGVSYYIECKVKIHASAGTVDIWVNGTNWLSLTGQNTKAQTNADITKLGIGSCTLSSGTCSYDDFYAMLGSTSAPLGDVRVIPLDPTSDDGTEADWLKSTGSDGYALIDEDQANTSDYIYSSTASDYSLFGYSNLPFTPANIYAVAVDTFLAKSDAGTATGRNKMKSGSTTVDGATISPSTTYLNYTDVWMVDPDTSAAWSVSGVNALQAGVERLS
jgi:hypothetical protein